ncbi:hypothetical protein CERSUDRAFT_96188 [Gelatoporia subvermispora B]|uniref:DUF6535 domain-containing protein n=1 Tax=Ceriporiopsis subvermispora (strain B) TaxID=914234 RepID=M2QG01_CERS8|nr:hypothetical protein CERSUDRAFT_96188 [Gelatoporia subvermispora B]
MNRPPSANSDLSSSILLGDQDSNVVSSRNWLPYEGNELPTLTPKVSDKPRSPDVNTKDEGNYLGAEMMGNAAYATMKLTSGQPTKAVAAQAWIECAERIKEYDEETIKAWKEEIDTLLVFAGLFSAVVTAFNVQFIQLLQPDSAGMTVILLMDILQQMNGTTNVTVPNLNPPLAHSSVNINILWYSSLILSLAAASVGILVKQWLNQYTSGLSSISRSGARIRQFRYDALSKWRVVDILTLLPVLLLGALVLFLAGLIEILWTVQETVATVGTILASLLLTFTLVTTVLPTFVADCAYQSPQAFLFFLLVQTAKQPLKALVRFLHRHMGHVTPGAEGWIKDVRRFTRRWLFSASERNWFTWSDREDALVQIKGLDLDRHLLAATDIIFRDSTTLEEIIRPCLADLPPNVAIPCFYDIFTRRASNIVNDIPYLNTNRTSDKTMAVFADIVLDMLEKSREMSNAYDRKRLLRILKPLLQKAQPKTIQGSRRLICAFLNDDIPEIRDTAFEILREHYVLDAEDHLQIPLDYRASDVHTILQFAQDALRDGRDRQFMTASNLIVFIATSRHLSAGEFMRMSPSLDTLWEHLCAFLADPARTQEQWLIPALRGLVPRIFGLARSAPDRVPKPLVDALVDAVRRLDAAHNDGNWEDMMSVLRRELYEFRGIDLRRRR